MIKPCERIKKTHPVLRTADRKIQELVLTYSNNYSNKLKGTAQKSLSEITVLIQGKPVLNLFFHILLNHK